ncbi:DUF6090 family protein [Flavobacteriaceae bacterium KMM 6897]|nr:DUF6090 family protein [Flavobacteriaceae bacterium KMM 6897]MEB8346785.1 DUF6090 family protein [Flavobacteriaceae bacterium KMM 6898]
MIKLFRKIRQQLLTENKFSKYLMYAVGEIILVIIGILIALYINNKNEIGKNEDKFLSNLLLVHKELENNIQGTTRNLNYYFNKDSLIYSIMADTLTIDDYKNAQISNENTDGGLGLSYVIFNTTKATILNNSFIKLSQSTDKVPEKYYPIIRDLEKVYSHHRTAVIDWNSKMQSLENDNVAKFSDTYDWFSKLYFFAQPNNDAFNFFIEDPKYKNYISQYYFLLKEQRDHIQAFRIEATKSYFSIAKLLNLHEEIASKDTNFIVKKEMLLCYEGRYSDKSGDTFKIVMDANSLFVTDNGTKSELISLSPTKFMVQNAMFTFKKTTECDVPGFVFHIQGQVFHYTKNE